MGANVVNQSLVCQDFSTGFPAGNPHMAIPICPQVINHPHSGSTCCHYQYLWMIGAVKVNRATCFAAL